MIFSVYLDESGTHGPQDHLLMTACVGREYQWMDWQRSMQQLQGSPGITRLHATHLYPQLKENFPSMSADELQTAIRWVDLFVAAHLTFNLKFSQVTTLLKSHYRESYLSTGFANGIVAESDYRICFKYAVEDVVRRLWEEYGEQISKIVFFIEGGNEYTAQTISAYYRYRQISDEHIKRILGTALGVIDNSEKKDSRLFAADWLANRVLRAEQKAAEVSANQGQPGAPQFPQNLFRLSLDGPVLREMREATIEYHRLGKEFL